MRVINKIKSLIRNVIINRKNRKKLTNKHFSVISSNCNGGLILHDLKQQFNSPTVNLFFYAEDYIKFLEKLDYYLQCELIEVKDDRYSYPLGRLDDVIIHFMHYRSFDEAKCAWKRRLERLNKENLFVMMTDRDGCTVEIIKRFDKLPFKNKVIFTHKEYSGIKSAIYIKGFEKEIEVGELSMFKSVFSIRKYYDDFDYVSWFNSSNYR